MIGRKLFIRGKTLSGFPYGVFKSRLQLASIAGMLFFCACKPGSREEALQHLQHPQRSPQSLAARTDSPDLILRVSIEPNAAIAYALTYRCRIQQVLKGTLPQKELMLTVMAGDKIGAFFVRHSQKGKNEKVSLSFKNGEANQAFQMMPITGFVANNKTAWLLTRAEPD